MKRLIMLLFCSVGLCTSSFAVDFKQTTDWIGLESQVVDTTKPAAYQIADSVNIVVAFRGAGTTHLTLNAWYNAGDAEADTLQGILYWTDQVANIDADSGAGLYMIVARFYDYSNNTYQNVSYNFCLGSQTVVVKDTTASGRRLPDSSSVFGALWQLLSDSCLTEGGLDSLVDSLCGGMIAGLDSTQTAHLVAQVLHDSTSFFGRAVWRTLLAPYDTATGTFGQQNNGSTWFDAAIDAIVAKDTTASGRTLAGEINLDSLLLLQIYHLKAAGFYPGTDFYFRRHPTVDTLVLLDALKTDTLLYIIRRHPAGPAGATADSGSTAAGPDF